MYWQEQTADRETYRVPEDVIDLAYAIVCRSLPVDHAWELSQAVQEVLPWLAEEEGAGVHAIHVAESGNGWMRPSGDDDVLYLSRRTRLILRVPQHRTADARGLSGHTLKVAGNTLTVGDAVVRPFLATPSVFARYVLMREEEGGDETAFLTAAAEAVRALGVTPKKMLCGKGHRVRTPATALTTRSVLLADLAPTDSITLQQRGIGRERALGCGLFLPHKDIVPVVPPRE